MCSKLKWQITSNWELLSSPSQTFYFFLIQPMLSKIYLQFSLPLIHFCHENVTSSYPDMVCREVNCWARGSRNLILWLMDSVKLQGSYSVSHLPSLGGTLKGPIQKCLKMRVETPSKFTRHSVPFQQCDSVNFVIYTMVEEQRGLTNRTLRVCQPRPTGWQHFQRISVNTLAPSRASKVELGNTKLRRYSTIKEESKVNVFGESQHPTSCSRTFIRNNIVIKALRTL